MAYENITTETRGSVALITLNRPSALNALNQALIADLVHAIEAYDRDNKILAMVITGSTKAFAAGADVKEMQPLNYVDAYIDDYLAQFDRIAAARKPLIAAVAGFALGGGCELAMACDIVVAADTAKFGQPEITLGIMPGLGGTQRLARAMGKAKAMDLVLTGRTIDAAEAERCGLVSRVVAADNVVEEALKIGAKIADLSLPVVMMAKEAVNRASETGLAEGVRFERRLFHSVFATDDQKEGMEAFVEKRSPQFRNR